MVATLFTSPLCTNHRVSFANTMVCTRQLVWQDAMEQQQSCSAMAASQRMSSGAWCTMYAHLALNTSSFPTPGSIFCKQVSHSNATACLKQAKLQVASAPCDTQAQRTVLRQLAAWLHNHRMRTEASCGSVGASSHASPMSMYATLFWWLGADLTNANLLTLAAWQVISCSLLMCQLTDLLKDGEPRVWSQRYQGSPTLTTDPARVMPHHCTLLLRHAHLVS